MHQLTITIHGRVQAVSLRHRIINLAQKLNLNGYVENTSDGGINVVAQGKESSLQELLNWCQKGIFPAKIKGMNFEWQLPIKKYKKFKINKKDGIIFDEAKSLYNLSKEILTQDILKLDKEKQIPRHVVIIPDGNRRWAKERGWLPWVGHRKAAEFNRLNELFLSCKDIGIEYLTFWAFSSENWKRDKLEIDHIFKILKDSYKLWIDQFIENKIRFRHIGRKDRLPQEIVSILEEFASRTETNSKLNFQFCLDYNGRDDIVRAINKIISSKVGSVEEKDILNYLDTKDIPEPDLIIRTSGEIRTSGIMAYEAAYSELYFTNVYFPDFDAIQFKRAILDYAYRKRNYGGTNPNIHGGYEFLTDPDIERDEYLNLNT